MVLVSKSIKSNVLAPFIKGEMGSHVRVKIIGNQNITMFCNTKISKAEIMKGCPMFTPVSN